MGRYLSTYFTETFGIKMHRRTFVMWNVLPDLAPSLLKLSHFKKDIYDLVMERAAYLEAHADELSPKEFSKQMGILCHFMADFFCYAHAEYFSGSKVGHLKYEILMQFFGYRRRDMLHAVNFLSQAAELDLGMALYERINLLHEQYASLAPSYGVDFVYSITACVEIMLAMLKFEPENLQSAAVG